MSPPITVLDPERWKPVAGHEGEYEVSDHGHVRSLDRTITTKSGVVKPIRGRMMKPHVSGYPDKGYRAVNLGRNNTHRLHRLVLTAFVGPCPKGMEGRHLDGDPSNNHLSNLAWGTPRENALDRVRHGTHNETAKTHCPQGHILAAPNLVDRPARKCRTCNTARARVRNTGGTFAEWSEHYYRLYRPTKERAA